MDIDVVDEFIEDIHRVGQLIKQDPKLADDTFKDEKAMFTFEATGIEAHMFNSIMKVFQDADVTIIASLYKQIFVKGMLATHMEIGTSFAKGQLIRNSIKEMLEKTLKECPDENLQ